MRHKPNNEKMELISNISIPNPDRKRPYNLFQKRAHNLFDTSCAVYQNRVSVGVKYIKCLE